MDRRAAAAEATWVATAVIALFAIEAVHWQVVYHRNGPDRLAAFEAEAPYIVDRAFRRKDTVYAFRFNHPQYIDLLFYGALEGREELVDGDPRERRTAAARRLFIGRQGECEQCPALDTAGRFRGVRVQASTTESGARTSAELAAAPRRQPAQFLVGVDNSSTKFVNHIILG